MMGWEMVPWGRAQSGAKHARKVSSSSPLALGTAAWRDPFPFGGDGFCLEGPLPNTNELDLSARPAICRLHTCFGGRRLCALDACHWDRVQWRNGHDIQFATVLYPLRHCTFAISSSTPLYAHCTYSAVRPSVTRLIVKVQESTVANRALWHKIQWRTELYSYYKSAVKAWRLESMPRCP